jgi:phenylacetate-CoA ligase
MLFNPSKVFRQTIYGNNPKSFQEYYRFNVDSFERFLKGNQGPILKAGEQMALNLFHEASQKVPAYKNFLKENSVDPRKIKSLKDFKLLPTVSKKNYLSRYELKDLSWNGNFHQQDLVSISSGSTGEPFYWPRGLGLEFETTLEYELVLKNFFDADRKSTLFIIGYAMGMYVAGVFTQNSIMRMIEKGYEITLLNPGADTDSIIKIVEKLGGYYDQVIISAYSPVLKDLIDKGTKADIKWNKYNLKFISGGEGFSEEYRRYVYRKLESKSYLRGSMNTYGSADAAILGHETPLSILIRDIANKNHALRKELFGQDRTPSLNQYYPFFKYFEEKNGDLIFSTFGGIPLVKYSVGDNGGLLTFETIKKVMKEHGINLGKEMRNHGAANLEWSLPFVFLFGRKDNTKIFYGANIYPEHLKACLEIENIMNNVTGKYFVDIILNKRMNQKLYLAVELIPDVNPSKELEMKIAREIHQKLLEINAEYKYLSNTMGDVIFPTLELFKFSDPKYFKPSIKPRYVRKK